MELTTIDMVFIVIYFLILLITGIIVNKKETNEDFLISSRNLGLISSISTLNASKTGAIIMIYTALVFAYGISAIWYFIGSFIGYLVFIPFAIKLFKQSAKKQYTLPEYFFKNYGFRNGQISTLISIIIMLGFLIINLIAFSKVFEFFIEITFFQSAILVISVILLYLMFGGFKAVVKTDIIQYISIIGILILIPISLINSSLDITGLNWNFFELNNSNLFGFLLLGILLPFASPELWQRIYAMPDIKTLKRSIIISSAIYFLFGIMLTLIAIVIKIKLPQIDPNIAFANGLVQLLPNGLVDLTIVLLISAFMSSIDTYLYTASSTFIQNFTKTKDKNMIKKNIRITSLVFGIVCLILTLYIADLVDSVYITAFAIILAIPTIMTWIKPDIKSIVIKSGFLIGLITLCILLPFEFMKDELDSGIVLKAIGATLIGLFFGWILSIIQSYLKQKKQ